MLLGTPVAEREGRAAAETHSLEVLPLRVAAGSDPRARTTARRRVPRIASGEEHGVRRELDQVLSPPTKPPCSAP